MEEKTEQEEYKHVCRLCNKKYPSGKSLGGHMRSHVISKDYVPLHKVKSKKAINFCNGNHLPRRRIKGKRGKQKCKEISMESHSDNGVIDDQRSAKEARYRAIPLIDSFSLENGCSTSSKSEIELEQEQVALCLMMLSRDSTNRISTSPESSANNSVILQVNGFVEMKKLASKKLNCVEMDSSDSGYFENGAKEVESDDPADGYARNYGVKRPKAEYGSSSVGKRSKNSGICNSEGDELGNQAQLKFMKKKNDHLNSEQSGKYKCSICQRSFKTHQALGGHIITHRTDFNGSSKKGENSTEASKFGSEHESYVGKISSTKGHCCPFCHKVFRSGQALGGHKRSHLTGSSSQDKANPLKNHRFLIDLNLPASPVEENGSFMPDIPHQDSSFSGSYLASV
ncbi:hypothetical protein V2J09_003668 [Rumex salicifolius]